jgi:hypothetical protein
MLILYLIHLIPSQHNINDNLAQYLISCVIEPDIGLKVSLVVKKDRSPDRFSKSLTMIQN